MDERIRSIPKKIRECLTETGIIAHSLWLICTREILQGEE